MKNKKYKNIKEGFKYIGKPPEAVSGGEFEDVPNVTDDDEYVTYRSLTEKIINTYLKEQGINSIKKPGINNPVDDDELKTDIPQQVEPPPDINQDPNMMQQQDPNAMAGGMQDPNMMTGEEEQRIKDPEDIGRVFELKKIYSRLVSIESFLSSTSDVNLLKLRNYVSDAIELFRTLINNVTSYMDRLPEIIIIYYKFVMEVYMVMKDYLNKKEKLEKNGKI